MDFKRNSLFSDIIILVKSDIIILVKGVNYKF